MNQRQIELGGLSYRYAVAQPGDKELFSAFNTLARQVFGLDFAPWEALGQWSDRYIPHLLLDGNTAVANVSVNRMKFAHRREAGGEGEELCYIQLGTVMTHPAYRGRGLARWLMEEVLAHWETRCGGIYLYARDDAAAFYPRFGFTAAEELGCLRPVPQHPPLPVPVRLLDMNSGEDRTILLEAYARGNPYAALEMQGNPGLVVFHAMEDWKDCFYHIEVYNAVVAARQEGDTLFCMEVLGGRNPMLDTLTASLLRADTRRVAFGFTPLYATEEELHPLHRPNTTLMLRGCDDFLKREHLLLPLLSQA